MNSLSACGLRFWRLLSCLLSLPILLLLIRSQPWASEIRLKRQWGAKVDGQVIDCAFAGGMELSKPTFVDIDEDGDLDLFIGDGGGQVRFFRNEGTAQNPRWHFVSDLSDSALAGRSSPCFADVDDDGDTDLFVGNQEGRIVFFENQGTPGMPSFVRIADFYNSIDVGSEAAPFFADVDADSDFDLFVGKGDGKLSFYRNTGTGQMPSWEFMSDYYDSIDVGANSAPCFADIDADDDFDLFVGEDQGNLNLFRNVGSDTMARWELASTDYNSIEMGRRSAPVFANIDGDSDLDLFIGQHEGQLCFYENEGSLYLPSWTLITGNYVYLDLGAHSAPALADIDADGDNDLFVGESQGKISFYRTEMNIPQPGWTRITENYFAIEADDYSLPEFGDVDADGDLDLLVGRKDGRLEFYRNIGSPQSALWNLEQDQLGFIDVGGYASPALADVDGDADLDMFVGQTYGKICFYRNDGTPQVPSWILADDQFESIDVGWYSAPALGDLDLDGDLDLLVGNDQGRVFYYRNDGLPEAFSFVLNAECCDSIDVGERAVPFLEDFDSDGDPDLFVGDSKGGLHYYKNLTLNSIRGRVSDGLDAIVGERICLSGDKNDSTFTDSAGSYGFISLPVGNYCVFREPSTFQYCFSPLESDTFEINFVGATQVGDSQEQNAWKAFKLYPNYPNPFNPVTTISYFLLKDAQVKLTIYNLRGERVRELASGLQARGWKTMVWDGRDSKGEEVASGVYFCDLRTDEGRQVIRMVLLK